MHFDIAIDARTVATFLTMHDRIFRETLLAGLASRRATSLKMTVSLRSFESELKISVNYGIS